MPYLPKSWIFSVTRWHLLCRLPVTPPAVEKTKSFFPRNLPLRIPPTCSPSKDGLGPHVLLVRRALMVCEDGRVGLSPRGAHSGVT